RNAAARSAHDPERLEQAPLRDPDGHQESQDQRDQNRHARGSRHEFRCNREDLCAAKIETGADLHWRREDRRRAIGREIEVRGAGSMSVWVVVEAGHRMAAEAIAAGRQFSQALGVPLIAATIASDHAYTADGFTAAYEAHIKKVAPKLVVFAHTYQTRD